jgi:putative endonuclease
MTDNTNTGNWGENVAADFLAGNGFDIVARNYRYKHAEIDIIVKQGDLLVFVEVKTRKSSSYVEPESFVDSKKAAKIVEGAEQYLHEINCQGNIRFDIISVKPGSQPEVIHFEDAFH